MRVVIDAVSVMAAYFDLLCVCIVHRQKDNDTHIGIRFVILAKRWMWLPDDGFYVNRNMLEQLL